MATHIAELNVNAIFPQYFLKALISNWYMNFNRPVDTAGICWEQTEDVDSVYAFIQSVPREKTMNLFTFLLQFCICNSLGITFVFHVYDLFSISDK